jgi:hypothetical protein
MRSRKRSHEVIYIHGAIQKANGANFTPSEAAEVENTILRYLSRMGLGFGGQIGTEEPCRQAAMAVIKHKKQPRYITITGRAYDLKDLNQNEIRFLLSVQRKYQPRPEWTEFSAWWTREFDKSGLSIRSAIYRVCQDMEARLGIAQGKVSPPDYRDHLCDFIEEKYGSQDKFCEKMGIDRTMLNRLLR